MHPSIIELARLIQVEPQTYSIPPRALFVGGFVRDHLLQKTSKDADIEVFGVSPDRLFELVSKLYPGRVHQVGKAFGILKIILEDSFEIDLGIPRLESKISQGHRGFSIDSRPDLDPIQASRRRDFTINAIMLDPLTDEIIDPWQGQLDLKNKILKMVDPTTFIEDPLRVYRAIQFSARFDLTIDPATFQTMSAMVANGALDELSPERLTEEWKKLLLRSKNPSIGLELMKNLGINARYYPIFHELESTPQEPEWHPEGDVWIHTKMVIDSAVEICDKSNFNEKDRLIVMLASLCHDFGKPSTTQKMLKDGQMRIRSLGHEPAGETPTRDFLSKFIFGEDIVESVVLIVKHHLAPGTLYYQFTRENLTNDQYANAVRKLLKSIHPTPWQLIIASAEADYKGRLGPYQEKPCPYREPMERIISERKLDQEPTKPLISGQDLIALGVAPGPNMGNLISTIETARDQGQIKTKAEALEYIKNLL